MAGVFSEQRRKRIIAVSDQARAQQGDRSFFHLFDEKPIRTVGVRNAVYLLAERAADDYRVDLAGANDFERLLCFAKPRTQFLDLSMMLVRPSLLCNPSGSDGQSPDFSVGTDRGTEVEPNEHLFCVG